MFERLRITLVALVALSATEACTPVAARDDADNSDATLFDHAAHYDVVRVDAMNGCGIAPPTSCGERPLRYGDIEPILASHCVSCHNGTDGGPWALTDYARVSAWAVEVRNEVARCEMPPEDAGMQMSDDERFAILLWVACGARP